jgi:hypothetical protein
MPITTTAIVRIARWGGRRRLGRANPWPSCRVGVSCDGIGSVGCSMSMRRSREVTGYLAPTGTGRGRRATAFAVGRPFVVVLGDGSPAGPLGPCPPRRPARLAPPRRRGPQPSEPFDQRGHARPDPGRRSRPHRERQGPQQTRPRRQTWRRPPTGGRQRAGCWREPSDPSVARRQWSWVWRAPIRWRRRRCRPGSRGSPHRASRPGRWWPRSRGSAWPWRWPVPVSARRTRTVGR